MSAVLAKLPKARSPAIRCVSPDRVPPVDGQRNCIWRRSQRPSDLLERSSGRRFVAGCDMLEQDMSEWAVKRSGSAVTP